MILSGTTSTALTFHYETQPLPTWLGWYAHQLPDWLHKTSAALMFAIELAIPLSSSVPEDFGIWPGALLIGLQLCIVLTGNLLFLSTSLPSPFACCSLTMLRCDGFLVRNRNLALAEAGSRAFCAHPLASPKWPPQLTLPSPAFQS